MLALNVDHLPTFCVGQSTVPLSMFFAFYPVAQQLWQEFIFNTLAGILMILICVLVTGILIMWMIIISVLVYSISFILIIVFDTGVLIILVVC